MKARATARAALGLLIGSAPIAGAEAIRYVDIAAEAGLQHVFPNGGDRSKAWILETTGSGAAFFDFNADGLPDAFVVSGQGGTNRLYQNQGGRRFVDVTERAGLLSEGWGQGACVGDVDNDGFADLFVTYWGENRLYRNQSGKRFERLPVPDSGSYSTGCAFLDADNDGDLDLFIANYLEFDFERTPKPGQNPYCFYRDMPVACGPRGLPFARNEFLRNEGAGRFADASRASGIGAPGRNYSLGAVSGDFNGDGWADIYVACDRTPSILYINQRDGTFADEAVLRGVAFDEHGEALSGMGVAAGDMDGDGRDDIFRTNFSDERSTLYTNRGDGDFDDSTVRYGLGVNTRFVGWGCGFLDADNDGWRDILLVNGHVFPEVETLVDSDLSYREPPVLYRSLAGPEIRGHLGQFRTRDAPRARRARPGLGGHRQRRQGRSVDQQPERAAGPAGPARRRRGQLDRAASRGQRLEPQRDWRKGARHRRNQDTARGGQRRRQLPVATRLAAPLRAGLCHRGGSRTDVAERCGPALGGLGRRSSPHNPRAVAVRLTPTARALTVRRRAIRSPSLIRCACMLRGPWLWP